jgi:hypothetical protein
VRLGGEQADREVTWGFHTALNVLPNILLSSSVGLHFSLASYYSQKRGACTLHTPTRSALAHWRGGGETGVEPGRNSQCLIYIYIYIFLRQSQLELNVRFGFRDQATCNVEGFPTFRQTFPFPSSELKPFEWFHLRNNA